MGPPSPKFKFKPCKLLLVLVFGTSKVAALIPGARWNVRRPAARHPATPYFFRARTPKLQGYREVGEDEVSEASGGCRLSDDGDCLSNDPLQDANEIPNLPLETLIMQRPDKDVWKDEVFEFNGLRSDRATPTSLQAYWGSYVLPSGMLCHAFDGSGVALSEFVWKGMELSDTSRVQLIMDLLSAISYLHSRGSAHLGLDANCIRIIPAATGEDRASLRVVGLGAAVELSLASGRSTFQLGNTVGFHPPELLATAMAESNLRALFDMDAWAVGVLVAVIAGSTNASPFEGTADWTKGILTDERATLELIDKATTDMGKFLMEIDAASSGFLFRHGWVVKLIVEFLRPNPTQRLSVYTAFEVATNATLGGVKHEATANKTVPSGLPRLRKAFKVGKDNEPYRSLEAMVNIIDKGFAEVLIEERDWAMGIPYGEILGFRNRADADRWDIFVPGLEQKLPMGVRLPVEKVLGVMLIKGGNHKIAVSLQRPYLNEDVVKINDDIRTFREAYKKHGKVNRVKYLSLEELDY